MMEEGGGWRSEVGEMEGGMVRRWGMDEGGGQKTEVGSRRSAVWRFGGSGFRVEVLAW